VRNAAARTLDLLLTWLKWGWPLVIADAALAAWTGEPLSNWRKFLNTAAFGWVLAVPAAPLSLFVDHARRERIMGHACGLREGDERERAVTGEAARGTLLLGLCLQSILLVLSLVSVSLDYDSTKPAGSGRGRLQVGMSFSSERHLKPFSRGAPPEALPEHRVFGSYLVPPAAFPFLALIVVSQLVVFRILAQRRYDGVDA
jgi:hypothetical protein